MSPRPGPPLPYDTLRAVVENASDAIFVTDESLRIEWVNDSACRILGFPFDALVGKRIADFGDPDELASQPHRVDDLRAGITTTTVRTFRTSTGENRVLEVVARRVADGRFLGVARDVTERHAAERRLSRSEASFRALIEASTDGIIVHRAGKVVYANRAVARMLGWPSAGSLLGQDVLAYVHPDDRADVAARISGLLAGAPTTPFRDERVFRRDDTVLRVAIGGVRVVFEGELSIVAVLRDDGEERRVREQLEKADRLASLGTLAAGVAHEINNPLTYVLLHLDALASVAERARPSPIADVILEHATLAAEGAQRVARIVRDLRAFSRADDEHRLAIDVHRPLEIATSTASHEIKHRARLVLDLGVVPPVVAGEGRLAQIFLNLLLNAAHAIPEGTPDAHEIRVRTWFEAEGENGHVHVAVRDTGAGIAEEHRKRLFEPFFTTKPVGIGSGLGLAICHGLVTALGGVIEVESEPSAGSTFTVVLPAAPIPAAQIATPEPTRAPPRRARVLVIDDEPSIGRAIAFALRAVHDVVAVPTGAAALDLLARDERFDLVLCDVVMPDVDGPAVHRWLHENQPALAARMLFMSGGRMGEASRAIAELAPSRTVEKPFTLASLAARIAEALRAQ